MRDDGVIDFEFEEVGVVIDGAEVGMFSGSASIDQDGIVCGLTLDAYVTDKAAPFGPPKKVFRYLKVPVRTKVEAFCTFTELLARQIANAIELGFEPEITDALNDWHVSLAEREFEREPIFPGSIATFVEDAAE